MVPRLSGRIHRYYHHPFLHFLRLDIIVIISTDVLVVNDTDHYLYGSRTGTQSDPRPWLSDHRCLFGLNPRSSRTESDSSPLTFGWSNLVHLLTERRFSCTLFMLFMCLMFIYLSFNAMENLSHDFPPPLQPQWRHKSYQLIKKTKTYCRATNFYEK